LETSPAITNDCAAHWNQKASVHIVFLFLTLWYIMLAARKFRATQTVQHRLKTIRVSTLKTACRRPIRSGPSTIRLRTILNRCCFLRFFALRFTMYNSWFAIFVRPRVSTCIRPFLFSGRGRWRCCVSAACGGDVGRVSYYIRRCIQMTFWPFLSDTFSLA